MILTVTLNPCVDKTLFTEGLTVHDSNRVLRTETDAGGKGVSLSRMAAQLGARTVATGFLGGPTGRMVVHALESAGAEHDFVEVDEETRTNVSIESGDGPPTVFSAKGPKVSAGDWDALLAKVAVYAKRGDWVALGGSLPPGVATDAYRVLGEYARQCGARVLLDADADALKLGLEAGPDMIKPNIGEAERLVEHPIGNLKGALDACRELFALLLEHGSKEPVAALSMGEHGAVVVTGGGLWYGVPPKVRPLSTIGSGDSFLAGFLSGTGEVRDRLRIAVAAGAATAMSDGTRIGTTEEVSALKQRTVVLDQGDLDDVDLEPQDGWPHLGYATEPESGSSG